MDSSTARPDAMVTVDSAELAQAVRRLKLVLRRKAQKRADARLYVIGGRLVIETDEGRMEVLASGEFGTSVRIQAVHLLRIGSQDRGSRPVTLAFDGEWLEVSDGRSRFRCSAEAADGVPRRDASERSMQQSLQITPPVEPSPNAVLPFEQEVERPRIETSHPSPSRRSETTLPRTNDDTLAPGSRESGDVFVQRAIELLHAVIGARLCSAAAMVSIAKVLHRLRRIPSDVGVGAITITVTGPRRWQGEVETYFWWDVSVEGSSVVVSSGGHFYRKSSGGDSFRSFSWQWSPGEAPLVRDYADRLCIVPGLESFALGIPDVSSGGYSVAVEDGDNDLLANEEDGETGEGIGEPAGRTGPTSPVEITQGPELVRYGPLIAFPLDPDERDLVIALDDSELDGNEPVDGYDFDGDSCSRCGVELNTKALAIDGRIRGEAMWGMFCASCYEIDGAGLGTGHGQLYARQRNGEWLLIAGFPSESQDT